MHYIIFYTIVLISSWVLDIELEQSSWYCVTSTPFSIVSKNKISLLHFFSWSSIFHLVVIISISKKQRQQTNKEKEKKPLLTAYPKLYVVSIVYPTLFIVVVVITITASVIIIIIIMYIIIIIIMYTYHLIFVSIIYILHVWKIWLSASFENCL